MCGKVAHMIITSAAGEEDSSDCNLFLYLLDRSLSDKLTVIVRIIVMMAMTI
jgi:hypothetical protein